MVNATADGAGTMHSYMKNNINIRNIVGILAKKKSIHLCELHEYWLNLILKMQSINTANYSSKYIQIHSIKFNTEAPVTDLWGQLLH